MVCRLGNQAVSQHSLQTSWFCPPVWCLGNGKVVLLILLSQLTTVWCLTWSLVSRSSNTISHETLLSGTTTATGEHGFEGVPCVNLWDWPSVQVCPTPLYSLHSCSLQLCAWDRNSACESLVCVASFPRLIAQQPSEKLFLSSGHAWSHYAE